jgi:histone H3/H4
MRPFHLCTDDETHTSTLKEIKRPSGVPFSKAMLRDFIARHVVKSETRVSKDALDLLNRVLDEVGGWIIREAEKMAASSGRSTISADHIRGAVKLYLGWEEKE